MNFSTAIVSSSRKRAGAKVNRYDLINTSAEAPKIYDAGGGAGANGLTIDVMGQAQLMQYKRTLNPTILEEENVKQEARQTELVLQYTTIVVNVRREDFPSITADIQVRYTQEALQAAWGQFVNDLRVALNVEFVDSILDRKDLAPVNRILGLRDGGQYFVRQREESAILEVIQSGKNPEQTSWKVTESINDAKERLRDSGVAQTKMDTKIDEILHRPTLRDAQRETTYRLLEAETSQEIVDAMWDIMNAEDLPPEEYAAAMTLKMKHEAAMKAKRDERTARLAYLVANGGSAKEIMELSQNNDLAMSDSSERISTKTYDKEVDIIGLHRLSFECLQRLLVQQPETGSEIAKTAFKFVQDAMQKFREEVDICVLGSKLLSDLSACLVQYRDDFYNVMLDNIQHYAPSNDDFRPPRIIRRKFTEMEKQRDEELWQARLEADVSGKVEYKDQGKLDIEVKTISGEDEMKFDLEAYLLEKAEQKRQADEEQAAKLAEAERLRLLALQIPEEVVVNTGPVKKVKKPWRGTKGYVGKPVEEEPEHKSMFDQYDDGLPKRRALKGFKAISKVRDLPVVPGIQFRGLVGPYKNDMAMLQCYATLYRFVCASYGNRERAFLMSMPEEVASIGLVCLGQPRILEYTMWIIDTVYMDGFMVEEEEDPSVAPSMALSKETWEKQVTSQGIGPTTVKIKTQKEGVPSAQAEGKGSDPADKSAQSKGFQWEDGDKFRQEKGYGGPPGWGDAAKNKKNGNIANGDGSKELAGDGLNEGSKAFSQASVVRDPRDPLIGMDIDCASTISQPTVDVDGINDRLEENIVVNIGDPNKDYGEEFRPIETETSYSVNITGDLVLDPEDKERGNRYHEKAMRTNLGLMDELGEQLYSQRYLRRPRDAIVLFCAAVSCHVDLQEREKEMGRKWLGLWDDASARYKRLIVVGGGLSSL